MTDQPAAAWFCVKSKPRQEAVAARHLRSLGPVELVFPRVRRTRRGHDKNREVVEPLFPGYLFLRYDPAELNGSVRSTRGVLHLVAKNGQPVEVDQKVIDELLAKGVTTEEVERTKNRLIADAVYAQDSQSTMARWFGAALTTGSTVEMVRSWPERIRAVTADRVLAAAKTWLGEKGYDPQFGARPLKRLIQKEIVNQLSKRILAGAIDKTKPVLVDVFDGMVVFRNEITEKAHSE